MSLSTVEHAQKAEEMTRAFRDKWLPILAKQVAKCQSHINDLVVQPLEGGKNENLEFSVHAQYILEDSLKKFRDVMNEMIQEHRQIHSSISKCGKELDRYFQMDLSGLMKSEKDLESQNANNKFRPIVNQLIFEHFLSLGRVQIAEIFMKECIDSDKFAMLSAENLDLMRLIMEPFRAHQFRPAIEWVEQNAREKHSLLFRLHSEHILHLLESNKKKEALIYCRALQPFAENYKIEIQRLMYLAVSWTNDFKVTNSRYEYMFPEGRWLALEEDLAACFSEYRHCLLADLISIGAKAIPTLLKMRALIRRNPQNNFTPLPSTIPCGNNEDVTANFLVDELFCEVPVQSRVHSSFCCPVMRTQATETNPPMRLHCGHVISEEALKRLSSNRTLRVKCPYCPEESSASDAQRIYF